jgi:hypothetical protein
MDGIEVASAEKIRLIAKELQLAVSAKHRTLYFHGESMRPFLFEGDEVVVEPVEWRQIRLGDVITYRQLDRFPTRRVVGKTTECLELWCDNWSERRFSAGREDVLGRAIARRRGTDWLAAGTLGWSLARARALLRYRARQAVRIQLPAAYWRARKLVGDLLRAAGLRRPRPSG